jgi:hypothetical protein
MQMGVVAEQVAEGLDGDESPGQHINMFRSGSEIGLQTLPAATAQIGEPLPVIQKAAPQNLGDAEDDVPVGHGLDDIAAQPLPEFHHSLLVAGSKASK